MAALALATVAGSVLVPLARDGRWRHLDLLAAAFVFLSCAIGHAINIQRGTSDWEVAAWELLTAIVAVACVREELATERAPAADQRLARVFAAAPTGMAVLDRRGCMREGSGSLRGIRRASGPATCGRPRWCGP